MRVTLTGLTVLLLIPHVDAAPAPASDRAAKEKLETLKKRLPDLMSDWLKKKENGDWLPDKFTCNPELRVLRRVGPDRAKAVILFAMVDDMGARALDFDVLLTVFLTYQDGCWTTERFEVVSRVNEPAARPSLAFLMLAIDEATEK
jgi:hypothetical protein